MKPVKARYASWMLIAGCILAVATSGAAEPAPAKTFGPPITVSKETTRITEPLRPDGYVDYAAALNQKLSQGVTPDNNSAVLFWQAVGPAEIDQERRAAYFKLLGIEPPPEQGEYFVALDDYIKRLNTPAVESKQNPPEDDDYDVLEQAKARPWARKDFPVIADWLAANEKPLTLLLKASQRPRRFDPLVVSDDETIILMVVQFLSVETHREVSRALIARSMQSLAAGKTEDAWQDLLACHRLARLVGDGPTMIEFVFALALGDVAQEATLNFLKHASQSPADLARRERELAALRPLPRFAEYLDVGERFVYLSLATEAARNGLSGFARVASLNAAAGRKEWLERAIDSIGQHVDWDIVLQNGNAWYDRYVAVERLPSRIERIKALEGMDRELKVMSRRAGDLPSAIGSMLIDAKKGSTQWVSKLLNSLMLPATKAGDDAESQSLTRRELLRIAFALERFRADNGGYPTELAELAPKYLSQVPEDLMAAAPFHYARTESGYVLYSVGLNGKDDNAKRQDDDEDSTKGWDDLVVRIERGK